MVTADIPSMQLEMNTNQVSSVRLTSEKCISILYVFMTAGDAHG